MISQLWKQSLHTECGDSKETKHAANFYATKILQQATLNDVPALSITTQPLHSYCGVYKQNEAKLKTNLKRQSNIRIFQGGDQEDNPLVGKAETSECIWWNKWFCIPSAAIFRQQSKFRRPIFS
jgi:hypothetical protein